MKYIIRLLYVCCIIGFLVITFSCTSSFDDLNTNPDTTNKVTPAMLATGLILDNVKSAYDINSELLCKRIFQGERVYEIQYNRLGKDNFDRIRNLTNAQKMVELASGSEKDAYLGLYYYLKGWAFYRTTIYMGDIPYSEALQIDAFRYL